MGTFEELQQYVKSIRQRTDFVPEIGIVLGSGLGSLAEELDIQASIPYADIPSFPHSTAPGHVGRFVFGTLEGKKIVMMQGRIHLYEGYDAPAVVAPIRTMKLLGVSTLLLSNAAGAVNPSFSVGDLCVLYDQISTFVPSPLRGANDPRLGVRFPDMSTLYDPALRRLLLQSGNDIDILLHSGVYCQFPGPAYETPAEVRMARTLGADMVGMSTAIEAVAARHIGLRVAGLSLITNMAAGLNKRALSEQEVIDIGNASAQKCKGVVRNFLRALA